MCFSSFYRKALYLYYCYKQCYNTQEVIYKFLIKVGKTKKGLYVLNIVRGLPFSNCIYFLRVYMDTLSNNNCNRLRYLAKPLLFHQCITLFQPRISLPFYLTVYPLPVYIQTLQSYIYNQVARLIHTHCKAYNNQSKVFYFCN